MAEDTNKFAPGQRVICIDDEASFHRLREGAVYTVARAYGSCGAVDLAECPGRTWMGARFRPV